MRLFAVFLFLVIINDACAQDNCHNRLDFINFNSIRFHYYTDSSFITPELISFNSNDSVFQIPKNKVTDSTNWTVSSENVYREYSSLISYKFGKRSRDSGLVIFRNNLGEITLGRIGFYHDSTAVKIGEISINNRTSIYDIKELFPCSWRLFQQEKNKGWGLFRKDSYDPNNFRYTGYDLIRLEISSTNDPDPVANIYGCHIILYFDKDKLVCLEVYHGS